MHIDDIYPSKWLRANDLRGQSHTVRIKDVEQGTVGEKDQLIVSFYDGWKPLGLNKTNASAIAAIYGPDTDEWLEQDVVLFPTRVDFQGKMVDAIRVDDKQTMQIVQSRIKAASKAAKPSKKTAPPMTQAEVDREAGSDDDIPF